MLKAGDALTTECTIFLSISLLFYGTSTLFFQGHFLFRKSGWEEWGRRTLQVGMGIHALGLTLHFLLSGQPPFSNMLVVISLLVIALLLAGLLIERYSRLNHFGLLLAPLAFLGLLYPMLMPIHFEEAESILLRYPWLGVHVFISMLGLVGFALAFCSAITYLAQVRFLKKGRLNHYLPALDTAASATYRFAAIGFSVFTLGLGMGLIWLFGAPGEYLQPRDTKIWMALPTWSMFAAYLYLRGVGGRHGSRLKWLVILGFLLALANLFGVRHDFAETPGTAHLLGPVPRQSEEAAVFLPQADVHPIKIRVQGIDALQLIRQVGYVEGQQLS
jgi:ABC-type transport system involved in cytochrome c biogenesis permease subunit